MGGKNNDENCSGENNNGEKNNDESKYDNENGALQAWTRQALMVAACSESSSANCSRLPLTPTGDSSPSPGTKCSILGTIQSSW